MKKMNCKNATKHKVKNRMQRERERIEKKKKIFAHGSHSSFQRHRNDIMINLHIHFAQAFGYKAGKEFTFN